MNYLKLFEDYFDNLFKYLDKYQYRKIPDEELLSYNQRVDNEFVRWTSRDIKALDSFMTKIKPLNPNVRFLVGKKNTTINASITYRFKKDKINFIIYFFKLPNNYYVASLDINNPFVLKNINITYECDEYEGLLKFIKETIENINNGTLKIESLR